LLLVVGKKTQLLAHTRNTDADASAAAAAAEAEARRDRTRLRAKVGRSVEASRAQKAAENLSLSELMSGEFIGSDDEDDEAASDDDDESTGEAGGSGDGGDDGDDGDDDGDSDAPGEEEPKAKKKKKSHKEDLDALAAQDPEFYEFLKKNDKSLLDFDDSDAEEEDEEDGEGDGDDGSDGEDAAGDDDDGKPAVNANAPRTLTMQTFTSWQRAAAEATAAGRMPLSLVRKFARAFRSGCRHGDDPDGLALGPGDLVIPSQEVFHRVMVYCTKNMARLFDAVLERDPKRARGGSTEGTAHRPLALPDRAHPQYTAMRPLIKSFLTNLIHFMNGVSDTVLRSFVARHASSSLTPYMALYPGTAEKYLKTVLKWWATPPSSGDTEDPDTDAMRAHAFIAARTMAIGMPHPFAQTVLRSMYLTFARNARHRHPSGERHLRFLTDCVAEMYAGSGSVDPHGAYIQAFGFVRQLAIHIRSALSQATTTAYSNVYNWQFINCVGVWVRAIGRERAAGPPGVPSAALAQLSYPLIQLLFSTLNLVPSPRFFPLRLHCVELMIELQGELSAVDSFGLFLCFLFFVFFPTLFLNFKYIYYYSTPCPRQMPGARALHPACAVAAGNPEAPCGAPPRRRRRAEKGPHRCLADRPPL
jgi:nucleolar complex protein 2